MRSKARVIVAAISVIASMAACVVSHAQTYKETDLPFKAEGIKMGQDADYRELLMGDGSTEAHCIGDFSLKSLSLGDKNIPLKSTDITSTCMIQTRDYGNIRLKIDLGQGSYSILLTAKQERLFKGLTHPTTQPAVKKATSPTGDKQ
jgi:hypothetical protein